MTFAVKTHLAEGEMLQPGESGQSFLCFDYPIGKVNVFLGDECVQVYCGAADRHMVLLLLSPKKLDEILELDMWGNRRLADEDISPATSIAIADANSSQPTTSITLTIVSRVMIDNMFVALFM